MQLKYTTEIIKKNNYHHGKTKVHYRVLKLPQLLHVLSQVNPFPTFVPYSSKMRYYPTIQFSGLSQIHIVCYMPNPLHSLSFNDQQNGDFMLIVQFFPPASFSASCRSVFTE
jgi:hypothetical protein